MAVQAGKGAQLMRRSAFKNEAQACPAAAVKVAGNLPETLILFKKIPAISIIRALMSSLLVLLLSACSGQNWNNPYPASQSGENIFFGSFEERPKHLDPARSYSSNEWAFISQIYEPPLQYHFLKRPYELVPLTLERMPEVVLLDASGQQLPVDASEAAVAFTEYRLSIKAGIRYQPHPAFAKREDGSARYWPLDADELDNKYVLSDFTETGTRELTAQDYIYQIKRLATPENHSPIAGVMADHIVGFSDFMQRAKAAREADKKVGSSWTDLRKLDMEGLQSSGRYRFSIRIKKRYPQFIYWLAMNFFAPMPWEAERFYAQPGMAERNLTLHWFPVGTGPYMLSENNPNLRMVLEANPNFRGELYPSEGAAGDRAAGLLDDAGKPMPFVKRAVYSLEKEAIPRWNKFLQGYYDNSGISSDSFDQAVQFGAEGEASLTDSMRERGIQLDTAVATSLYYMGFNMRDPVVGGDPSDPADARRARKLRQAIAIAMDWEEFISIFQNGRGAVAQGPLPAGIFGHRDGEAGINPVVYQWRDGAPHRRSIDDAKRLLAEAGYPDGRDPKTGGPLVLYYDTAQSGPGSKSVLQWYAKQFKKIGIQLVARTSDYNRFQEKMLKGTAQIFSWGWNADYPDPENFLFLLYGPNGKVEQHGENAANFSNAEFDRLFAQMKDLPNGQPRQKVIDRMVAILREESPWLFGFSPKSYSLHHAWYHNALPHLMANNTLKYKRIDGAMRAKKQAEWNHPVLWPVGLLLAVLVLSAVPAIRDYRARERATAGGNS